MKETDGLQVHLQTFGCQMNEYDSELVGSILSRSGYRWVEEQSEAKVILFNTCAIRETAHTRIYSRLDALVSEKKRREDLVVGVLGCMAQNLKHDLLSRFPALDFICGPDEYRNLPELIRRARKYSERSAAIELSEYETYDDLAPTRVEGINAWIAVMRGCDNFCTFCVVPSTRGRERSRDPEGVVTESQDLANAGYPQVTLLGQNVNSYQFGDVDFAGLLRKVAAVPGIERVRYTSPHPKDFPAPLLAAMAEDERICSHIHLPLQAGSDRILDLMNRGYGRDEFLRLVDRIRKEIDGVTLTTDVICGFPSETDDEFNETEEVLRRVEFDSAFIFKYSRRHGTISARRWEDDVPEQVKSERVTSLVELQREVSLHRNQSLVGRTLNVLVEGTSRKDPGQWKARTDGNRIVVFSDARKKVGDWCRVRIQSATPNTLLAEPADDRHPGESRGPDAKNI